MEESLVFPALGVALAGMGAALCYYLVDLCLHLFSRTRKKEDPPYVREINGRLNRENVETERDLI